MNHNCPECNEPLYHNDIGKIMMCDDCGLNFSFEELNISNAPKKEPIEHPITPNNGKVSLTIDTYEKYKFFIDLFLNNLYGHRIILADTNIYIKLRDSHKLYPITDCNKHITHVVNEVETLISLLTLRDIYSVEDIIMGNYGKQDNSLYHPIMMRGINNPLMMSILIGHEIRDLKAENSKLNTRIKELEKRF